MKCILSKEKTNNFLTIHKGRILNEHYNIRKSTDFFFFRYTLTTSQIIIILWYSICFIVASSNFIFLRPPGAIKLRVFFFKNVSFDGQYEMFIFRFLWARIGAIYLSPSAYLNNTIFYNYITMRVNINLCCTCTYQTVLCVKNAETAAVRIEVACSF